MTPIVKTLVHLLDIKDPLMERLRRSVVKSFDDAGAMQVLLARQCENREETHCYGCEQECVCLFLNGVLYFKLGENDKAVVEIENAHRHFRNQGDSWNSVIGQAMLASAYEAGEKTHLAVQEYKKARGAIDDYLKLHSNEYDQKALTLQNLLQDQIEYGDAPKKTTRSSRSAPPKKARPARPAPKTTRLGIPWMPNYGGVHANPGAPTQSESARRGGRVYIDEIILDGKPHRIISLRSGDHLLTLVEGQKYGWTKVSGDSMSAAKPVAINENEFVLYYVTGDAEHGSIVVASCPDAFGSGYQFVVKRLSKANRLLLSETDPPDLYEPMPINKNIKIIGVVIAVAKPGDGAEEGAQGQDPDAPQDGASRYIELVQLVQGDVAVADRLIDHEKDLFPQSSREECIEKAIIRLRRDRRA